MKVVSEIALEGNTAVVTFPTLLFSDIVFCYISILFFSLPQFCVFFYWPADNPHLVLSICVFVLYYALSFSRFLFPFFCSYSLLFHSNTRTITEFAIFINIWASKEAWREVKISHLTSFSNSPNGFCYAISHSKFVIIIIFGRLCRRWEMWLVLRQSENYIAPILKVWRGRRMYI